MCCKRVLPFTAVVGLLLLGGYTVYKYSGARGKVAKQKILNQLDEWLGKSDVRRQEIVDKIEGMEKGIDKLSDVRRRQSVQADMLKGELKLNEKKLQESTEILVRLKKDLEMFKTNAEYSVRYGSKDYTREGDLDKLANRVVDAHTLLKKQTDAMKERLAKYEENVEILTARETERKKEVNELKNELTQLDADIALAKAHREAAEALNETDKTFAESVADLKAKMKDLKITTKTALAKEDEKRKDISAHNDVEDVTKIVTDSKDTIRKIDELLGNK
jgi:hypothetical protein